MTHLLCIVGGMAAGLGCSLLTAALRNDTSPLRPLRFVEAALLIVLGAAVALAGLFW